MNEPLCCFPSATDTLQLVKTAAPQGRVTPAHHHTCGQLYGTEQGLLTAEFQKSQWVIPATHAVWVPANCLHGMTSHGAFYGWSLYFHESISEKLPVLPKTFPVSGLLREALRRVETWHPQTQQEAQQALTTVMVHEILDAAPASFGLPMPADPRLLNVARRLLSDVSNTQGVEQWAAGSGLSARTLIRLFPLHTGFTFSAWRQRARMMRAVELLASGERVQNVALEVGYDNTSAFIAVFRKALGTTPGNFVLNQRLEQ